MENTDLESSGETGKPRENLYEEKERKFFGENTEESDINLSMTSIKNQKRGKQARKSKRRVKQHSKEKTKDLGTTVHKSLAPASPSASYHELCKISDDVMLQLQVVRDNGKWESFDDIVVTLSHKYRSPEAQVVILLEKGVAACYQSRLEESKEMIMTAINMANGTENSSTLIGKQPSIT
jgi:hypothetical protein